MGKTNIQYNTDWEKDYDFLAPVIDVHKAQSKKCNCICSIKSGGCADIKRLTISKKHRKLCPETNSDDSVKNQLDNSVNELDKNNKILALLYNIFIL